MPDIRELLTLRNLLILAGAFAALAVMLALWVRLTPEVRIVEFALERGEKQLWIGIPRQGYIVQSSDIGATFGALFCFGFFYVWESRSLRGAASDPFDLIFAVFGIPIFVVGVYVLFGRYFHDAWKRKRTSYALTNARAIISVGAIKRSYSIDLLRSAELQEHADGTGTIVFGTHGADPDTRPVRSNRRRQPARPQFERIAEAGRVFAMMRELTQASAVPVAT